MIVPTAAVPMATILKAIYLLRADAEQIDGEWGSGRSADQIRATYNEDDYGYEQVQVSDELWAFIPNETDVLDPEPWVIDYHNAGDSYRVDKPRPSENSTSTFQPRRGYSQNREDYA